MRIVKLLFGGLAGLIALLALIGSGLYLSDPWLWKRYATSLQGLDVSNVDWRSPAEVVPGGDRRLPENVVNGISAEALREAMAYAEQTESYALLIHHRGALVVERYWGGHGPDSRFDTASMHKSVMALLLGIAIDEGHIGSINDPVGRYVEEWANDPRGEITLRQLATMSSGLLVEAFRPSPFSKGMRLVIGSNIDELALSLPLDETPGTRFEYLNFSSQVLGIALTRAVGMRYAEYLSQRLWQPLGAPDTAVWLDREGGSPRTFCCLLASAPAWMHVGVMMLNEGRVDGRQVVPAQWLAEMTTPSALNPNYGLKVWLGSPASGVRTYNSQSSLEVPHSEAYLADDVVFLDGAGGQRVYVIPSAELVIVRIGKSRMDWDDAVLPNALLRGRVPGT
ncbi:MAG: serine hydrolase [Gammaproteobacteria bacterium]|nr:serine hydrolase [Gammaproteobacteria bacterium]